MAPPLCCLPLRAAGRRLAVATGEISSSVWVARSPMVSPIGEGSLWLVLVGEVAAAAAVFLLSTAVASFCRSS